MFVWKRVVPTLRINNRALNQKFFEETLGLKTQLEEGPFVELRGELNKNPVITLMESPSMITRAVVGPKKLKQVVLKVENPLEIEQLLAKGSRYSKVYRGKKGYAFEAISPERDCFLVHSEESLTDLVEVTEPISFDATGETKGLTKVVLEQIVLHTPHLSKSQAFYQGVGQEQDVVAFQEAQGSDLEVDEEETWDLANLQIILDKESEWSSLESFLRGETYFKDKKEHFIDTLDPSRIGVRFEKEI